MTQQSPQHTQAIELESIQQGQITSEVQSPGFSLHPVDKGFHAWAYITAAFLVEALIWGFPDSFGVFLEVYLADPKYTTQPGGRTLLALIGTLSSGILFCSSPFMFYFSHKFPNQRRIFIWTGVFICLISIIAASFTDNVRALVVLQGVLYALGGSLMYTPCISFFAEWFVARQGLAFGLISAGTSAGGVILPIVLRSLISRWGTRAAMRYFVVGTTIILIPAVPFMKPRISVSGNLPVGPDPRGGRWSWMKKSSFWCIMAMTFIQAFSWWMPIFYLPTFATSLPRPSTPSQSALTLSLLSFGSAMSRLAIGILADKYSPWTISLSMLVGSCLATFFLWGIASSNLAGLLAFGLIFGIGAGGWPSIWTGFMGKVALREDTQARNDMFSLLMFARGAGNILSAPLSAALYSAGSVGLGRHGAAFGFGVDGGRFGGMILFVGLNFGLATLVGVSGLGREIWKSRVRVL
ncbi:MFS general substrate transporter [Flagelloscypha sp. PMI_526]|nr:MFS general substrate transporter [Flagelloscypha sp. PMI_526]